MLAVHGGDGNGRRVVFQNHLGTKVLLRGKQSIRRLMKVTW